MNYLSKNKIIVYISFFIFLVISIPIIFSNRSYAYYNTRIEVNTMNLEIIPYQHIDIVDAEENEIVQEETQSENADDNVENLNNNLDESIGEQ